MSVRTTETTVTFKRPFTLPSVDGPQPAGTYRLVLDEEEILGISFLAFRRMATMLHTPAISVSGGPDQVFALTSTELATALEADAQA
ncbi:hypothetical protein [Methylocapsa acidiphila]|uniref:hypothetical protein n=1 Tax=Methylocapsa acidiphila TaxID=133552 RepID=UPI000423803A|nr:hypothetical protein [Methylocapsa acidiphila]